MAEIRIRSREELEAWLQDKPVEWARAIAHRTAMRVLPLVAEEWKTDSPIEQKQGLTLAVFRANLVSRIAGTRAARNMKPFLTAAAFASASASSSAASDRASAASAAARAAASAAARAATERAFAAARASAASSAGSAASAAASAVWKALSADTNWLLENVDTPASEQAKLLVLSSLWHGAAPEWVRNLYVDLSAVERYPDSVATLRALGTWDPWLDWYAAVSGIDGSRPRNYFYSKLELEIATQDDKWWDRGAAAVNADIGRWVEEERRKVNIPNFILDYLAGRSEPSSLREIFDASKAAEKHIRKTEVLRTVRRLVADGSVERIRIGDSRYVNYRTTHKRTLRPVTWPTPFVIDPEERDFFVSYSNLDTDIATKIERIVREAGYSTYFQANDAGGGANFANWMKKALPASRKLIAIYSPDYEKSGHAQAEWNAFYDLDPMSEGERIIGFVVRETQLNVLAKQIVYKKVVGLSDDELKVAVLKHIRAGQYSVPAPRDNVPTPYDVGWTSDQKVEVTGPGMNKMFVPVSRSPQDAIKRLQTGKRNAANLAKEFSGHNRVDRKFVELVHGYGEQLPEDHSGNIYDADLIADRLRRRLIREAKSGAIDLDFAEGLVAILKHHQGLRVYFPDLILYRKEAASGELAGESLHEYFEKILDLIAQNTPQVFSENISEKLARTEPTGDLVDTVVSPEEIREAAKEGIVPPELLNDIDPQKAEDVAKAGLFNRIYEVLLTFEAGGKNADRIEKTISSYGKLIKHVLDWLE